MQHIQAKMQICVISEQTAAIIWPQKSGKFWLANVRQTRAQDYKEKHKLDSKQIWDSAFGAHLSFCQK